MATGIVQVPVPEIAAKKSNHQVNIVRIAEVLPHPNADNLELIHIGGYQAVVRKGDFKVGDLAVYIQPDSIVPQTEPFRFIWEPYLGEDATVPEKRRRITVRRFCGEWSEGLLLPIADFGFASDPENAPVEGADVSDLLGIVHYDPDAHKGYENTDGPRKCYRPTYRPHTLKGWFYWALRKLGLYRDARYFSQQIDFEAPVYDVESYKNHKDVIEYGEFVRVTEKIHGSNARYVYLDGVMYAGSRNLWKSPKSKCIWRNALAQNPWIQLVCEANPGYILYGEVTPTQKGFDYGNTEGRIRFFLFDILTPSGEWLPVQEYDTLKKMDRVNLGSAMVPVYYTGNHGDLTRRLVDGPSMVEGARHIREGIVIRPVHERRVPGLGRVQLKIVSNAFLEKDSKSVDEPLLNNSRKFQEEKE